MATHRTDTLLLNTRIGVYTALSAEKTSYFSFSGKAQQASLTYKEP